MPSITCDKAALDNSYGKIAEAVVTIKRFNESGWGRHNVYYSDGTSRRAFEFIRHTQYGHAILSVPVQSGEHRYPVKFSEAMAKREEVCMIARVKHDGEPGFMSGIVVAPSCKTMLRTGAVITRNENKFALTCSHGRNGDGKAEENLIGAAVFTLSGLFVGTIYSGSSCNGLKFATHSSFFIDDLKRMIHDKLQKASLSRDAPPLSGGSKPVHAGSKNERSSEDQTNIAAEKRQKIEHWCRSSPW